VYRILEKKILNESVQQMKIEAPLIAKKAGAGQFIILRIDERGERIPLTIAGHDAEEGTISIIFQMVGKTTKHLGTLDEGDTILDFVGPLGKASELEGYKKACVIGGGLGTAIAFPQAMELHKLGAEVDIIAGFRNKDLIILEEEMKEFCTNLYITTDDGSNGTKGFVTDILKEQLKTKEYDVVIAIGPLVMMKFVALMTKEAGIKTIVSMNSVMVDGTGMCGGCRLTVGDETKFACVDGPDFDGHLVDFDEAIMRSRRYSNEEEHSCRIGGYLNG
jgi:ferredoxin--NADP+ reductase